MLAEPGTGAAARPAERTFASGGVERRVGRLAGMEPVPQRRDVSGYFRAVAVDFDGTLAGDGRPDPAVLGALDEVRARGVRVLLVTGRILAELREAFPDVDDHVDAVVGENGAVFATPAGTRRVPPPVPEELAAALAARAVSCRPGLVLLACGGDVEHVVLDQVRRLGLDCQLVRNRSELMVLPAGVSKGTGLVEARDELGLSAHNTIAVGDAENDHSLLEVAEIAVANSVESLKHHADVVLGLADGAGVAELVRGPLVSGRERRCPGRWRVTLGRDEGGHTVDLPASQLNVLVARGGQRGQVLRRGAHRRAAHRARVHAGGGRPGGRPRRARPPARGARHRG